mgnify:CR=1 FL=1
MELRFIGNGSGFSRSNNNAFFENNDELIMIDCSMLNMNRIRDIFDFKKYNKINIFVTHMHADHVSGIPNIIQYLFHMFDIVANIIVPSGLKDDMKVFLDITGVKEKEYKIIPVNNGEYYADMPYLVSIIKTEHSENLLCFGYIFMINDKVIVYTGDTKTLEPFSNYLNGCDEAYIDVSYTGNKVHISWDYLKKNFPNSKKIYLMHIDDEKIVKECKKIPNVEVVKKYKK